MTTKTNITVTEKNATAVEISKLSAAVGILEAVINTQQFKDAVLNYDFIDTNGLTNQQIYDVFMLGKESYKPIENYTLDFKIEMYYKYFTSAIAYTYPNGDTIYFNRKFFKNMSPLSIAGTLAHEICHKFGFGHTFHNTPTRHRSVPYAIGYIVSDLAKDIQL